MGENIVKDKTLDFAVSAVKLGREIVRLHKEYILSKQFIKSATSVGAQVREAEFAQSKADFISKMSIGLKEANETAYWLIVLKEGGYISLEQFNSLNQAISEILKLLVSIVNSSKRNRGK